MESRTDSPDASVHDVVNVRTISDERLAELAVRVRPAIRVTDDHLREGVYCFETKMIPHDNWRETLTPCGQYHRATTTLYRASR